MPRAKKVLIKLNRFSAIKHKGVYIFDGDTDLSHWQINKGDKVYAVCGYRSYNTYISKTGEGNWVCVNKSEIYREEVITPVKFLVTKKQQVKEIFACTVDEAKTKAKKLLNMKRLTGVTIAKVGDKSYFEIYKNGVQVRVIKELNFCHGGYNIGDIITIMYRYSTDSYVCETQEVGCSSRIINRHNFELVL